MPRNIKPRVIATARVVVATNDASRDYYMLTERARQLYNNGDLAIVSCYPSELTYFDPQKKFIREAL